MDIEDHLAAKHNVRRTTEGKHVPDDNTLLYGPAYPPEKLEEEGDRT